MTHRQFEAFAAWLLLRAGGGKPEPEAEPELTVEEAARASKARWAARKKRAAT